MKKIVFILAAFLIVGQLQAQTTAPPLHETEEEEPVDLAPETTPKKKPAAPTPVAPQPQATPPSQETPPATPPTEEKVQVTPEKPIELPSPKPALPEPALPEPEPPKPEIKVPSNIPVVPVEPSAPGQATTVPEMTFPDGGPMKDAGADLTGALPITYAIYNENGLSSADTIDTYKFYGRTKEGVGVILVPSQPSSQLACEIVNERGELLSDTKALNPGEALSFQTSPLEQNSVLYFKIKDLNLLPDSPPTEIRKYSLELKPIQSITITQPAQPMAEVQPPSEEQPEGQKMETPGPKKETKVMEEPQEIDWFLYGLIGAGVLIGLLAGVIVFRKFRRPKEGQ